MLRFLLFFFIFSAFAFAFEEDCLTGQDLTGSAPLDNLSDISISASCMEFEKLNKCHQEEENQKQLNPDLLARALILRDKDNSQGSLIGNLYNLATQNGSPIKRDQFELLLKDRIVEFVKIRNCEPVLGKTQVTLGFDDIGGVSHYDDPRKIGTAKNDISKLMSDSEFKNKAKLKIQKYNEENFDNFLKKVTFKNEKRTVHSAYCSDNLNLITPTPSSFPIPSCKGSISKYFVDNKAVLKSDLSKELEKDQSDLLKCIRDNEEAGYVVKKVRINSSANQLRNTSTLDEIKNGNGFCGYDFLGLSKARSDYAKNKILPRLLTIPDEMIELNPKGSNGNGTSGPCPYGRDGNLLKAYSGSNKDSLDEFKSTDITVEFEATSKILNQHKNRVNGVARVSVSCRSFSLKCKGEP